MTVFGAGWVRVIVSLGLLDTERCTLAAGCWPPRPAASATPLPLSRNRAARPTRTAAMGILRDLLILMLLLPLRTVHDEPSSSLRKMRSRVERALHRLARSGFEITNNRGFGLRDEYKGCRFLPDRCPGSGRQSYIVTSWGGRGNSRHSSEPELRLTLVCAVDIIRGCDPNNKRRKYGVRDSPNGRPPIQGRSWRCNRS